MAEMLPPYGNVYPMRVMFMIPKIPAPTLSNPSLWSHKFHSFLAHCLTKDPQHRCSAAELLNVSVLFVFFASSLPSSVVCMQHPFLLNCKSKSVLVDLLDWCRLRRENAILDESGYESPDDPSRFNCWGLCGSSRFEPLASFGLSVSERRHHSQASADELPSQRRHMSGA